MKTILLFLFATASISLAHDHIEIGQDPLNNSRLGMDGLDYQLAVYVPPGEPFSGYLPQFPGDWHASELTFSAEVNALEPAEGSDPRIEVLSVSGPENGVFGFWEIGVTSPTWLKPSGWTNAPGDAAAFNVILGGDNHVHGRVFTMDRPGVYTVTFRAVDLEGLFADSLVKTITFVAQAPPPLAMQAGGGNLTLSFTSRVNLDYDLQSCTNLQTGAWVTETTIFGDGSGKNHAMPLAGPPPAFYRLVEY